MSICIRAGYNIDDRTIIDSNGDVVDLSDGILGITVDGDFYAYTAPSGENDAYFESSREDICDLIRLKVKHYVPRKIAIGVITNDWNDGVNLTK